MWVITFDPTNRLLGEDYLAEYLLADAEIDFAQYLMGGYPVAIIGLTTSPRWLRTPGRLAVKQD